MFVPYADPAATRFITRQLWVAAYDRDEMFATGDYPNQSAGGGGLPAYVRADRPPVDTDVVLWSTFGTNHVVRPEDWPVMPAHPIGFRLVPCGFFAGNPALDNPALCKPAQAHCHHGSGWVRLFKRQVIWGCFGHAARLRRSMVSSS